MLQEDFAQKRVSAKQTEDIYSTVHVVQSLVDAIPPTDLPLHKLREERLEKYKTT